MSGATQKVLYNQTPSNGYYPRLSEFMVRHFCPIAFYQVVTTFLANSLTLFYHIFNTFVKKFLSLFVSFCFKSFFLTRYIIQQNISKSQEKKLTIKPANNHNILVKRIIITEIAVIANTFNKRVNTLYIVFVIIAIFAKQLKLKITQLFHGKICI